MTVARARKIQRFLSQPFHVAEVFTGSPGEPCGLFISGIYARSTVQSPAMYGGVCQRARLFSPLPCQGSRQHLR